MVLIKLLTEKAEGARVRYKILSLSLSLNSIRSIHFILLQTNNPVGHIKQITALAITPDNDYFISAGAEGWSFLWELDSGRPLCCMKGRHNFDPKSGESYEDTHPGAAVNLKDGAKGISSLILIEDHYVITASDDGTAVIWNIREHIDNRWKSKQRVRENDDDIWPEPEDEAVSFARGTKGIPRARAVVVINKFNTGHRRNVRITCMALGLRGGKAKKRMKRKKGNRRMRMSAISPKSRNRGLLSPIKDNNTSSKDDEDEDEDNENTKNQATQMTTSTTKTITTQSSEEEARRNLEVHVLFTAGDDGSIAMWSLCPPKSKNRENVTTITTWDPPEPLRVFVGHGKIGDVKVDAPITCLIVVPQTSLHENQKLISAAADGTTFSWNASSSSISKGLRTTKPLERFVIGHIPKYDHDTLDVSDEYVEEEEEEEKKEENVVEEEDDVIEEKADVKKKKEIPDKMSLHIKTSFKMKPDHVFVQSMTRLEAGDLEMRQSIMRFGLNPRNAGHYLYAGLSDGTVGCWDMNKVDDVMGSDAPRWVETRSYHAHLDKKSCTQIQVDVKKNFWSMISCGKDKRLCIKNIDKNNIDRAFKGWCHTINAWTMDKDETRMICCFGKSPEIQIFQAETGDWLGQLNGHKKRVNCLDVISSKVYLGRQFLISGSYDTSVRLWDLATRECVFVESKHHVGYIYDLAVSQAGSLAFTACRDTSLAMWRVSEDRKSKNVVLDLKATFGVPRAESVRHPSFPLTAHPNRVWCCSLYPRDPNIHPEFLASGGETAEIIVWDLRRSSSNKSGDQIQFVLEGHTDKVYTLVFATSSNGDGDVMLISGSADASLRVWNMRDGSCVQILHQNMGKSSEALGHFAFHSSDIRSLAVLKDKQGNDSYVISGSQDKSMVIVSLQSLPFRVVESVRDSHSDKITKIHATKDGQSIFSVSSGVIRFDAKALIDWHVVKFISYFQKKERGNMVSRSPFVTSFGSLVTPLVEYAPVFEYVLDLALCMITIVQLISFALPFEGGVAPELQPLKSVVSFMEEFGFMGEYAYSYWMSLGPCIFFVVIFVLSMTFQEYIELKAFLTGKKKWKLLFNIVSLYVDLQGSEATEHPPSNLVIDK